MAISNSVMSSINGAPSVNPAAGGAMSSASSAQEMTDQFLTLLITQMQNQDPLNPMENSEMTSQIAQINTVSGIQDLNTTLSAITGQISKTQQLQASALAGKGVMVEGNDIKVGKEGVITPFGVALDKPASDVTVTIKDNVGNVVRTYDMGAISAGTQSFYWDGKKDDGTQAASGENYRVSIAAENSEGQLPAKTLNYAYVQGVNTIGDDTRLDIGTKAIALGDVYQIL
ncbi:flagellar hook assembly protein FlgD [Larsenimonas suaedae]|uniref:Basal-body rod modification protein FlgD n=1 Tax=Larsenimonas suaedae TaxID=1851019 RepID=A0ABU1GT20_9GAMM|nr:flagellar hook assembly protein FlgD [Larsenimonas suaedae]MCM2971625.1 flagellar hook assembly protein FlgD [Larsenimonas suaedae]MDR5895177.1 flagellar hook assembly protein FlgD [Larsenimonas suaedae]